MTPARFLCLPALACDGCGDMLCAAVAPAVCAPCIRRAELRRRLQAIRAERRRIRSERARAAWLQRQVAA